MKGLKDLRLGVGDIAIGAATIVLGIWSDRGFHGIDITVVFVGLLALAGMLARRLPSVALALTWIALLLAVNFVPDLNLATLVVPWIAFAVARWGHVATLWISGLSIVPAAYLCGAWARNGDWWSGLSGVPSRSVVYVIVHSRLGLSALLLTMMSLTLGVPWLIGLAMRALAAARQNREQELVALDAAREADQRATQEHEIAQLRGDQARLARDVHDVVGHSLAVILSQAESAAYLEDPEAMKKTMATVAETARNSLRDVRDVLGSTAEGAPAPAPGNLDELINGVRAAGHEVHSETIGTPRPLPPELATVAYRVTQEMLTNALRHGSRDRALTVARRWAPSGGLSIEVRNLAAFDANQTQPIRVGTGVDGMRRRLDSIGGRLTVGMLDSGEGAEFVATAYLPTGVTHG